ncbi:hypothetical protein LCL97_20990 [Seohaeicola saemankumensis]|nr:hypothetical protein [Seohaeicola saemankumensis]MCA0873315.1 hypothetical protein [Seohaeicola saemankumensis]
MMAGVVAAHNAGYSERANDIFDAFLRLIRFETQPGLGLVVRKRILNKRGVISYDTLRKLGRPLSWATEKDLTNLMARLDRRLEELEIRI